MGVSMRVFPGRFNPKEGRLTLNIGDFAPRAGESRAKSKNEKEKAT